jgi:transcriptional regulator with XRE-family HTH domain
MPSPQLPNYLQSNRKRLALSQDEVAFLLGGESGTKMSRYEHSDRIPSLETALAFEAIFKRPVSEIFGGLYQKAEQDVATRAKVLASRNIKKSNLRKREIFAELADTSQ